MIQVALDRLEALGSPSAETVDKHDVLLRRLRWTDWRSRHQAVLLPDQCAHPGLWKGQFG